MENKQEIFLKSLNFMALPFRQNTSILDEGFALLDNIDYSYRQTEDLSTDPTSSSFIASGYPVKIELILVIACLGGSMNFRVNMIDNILRTNDILVVTTGVIGECLGISPDCRLAIMAFSDERYMKEMNVSFLMSVQKFLSKTTKISLSDKEMRDYTEIYMHMRRKISQENYFYKKEVITGYLQVLICDCCQYVKMQEEDIPKANSRKLQIYDSFIAEVQRHYTCERSIGFYAGKLCITPKYLSRIVQNVSGKLAGEWIKDYVILEAKALLKSRQYTVQQIADKLNFPNQSTFGIYFKKAVGISPKAYQEK